MIPVLSFLQLRVIGRLYVSELLLAVVMVHLVRTRGSRAWDRNAIIFVWLTVIWLGAQVISDISQQTQFHDYARGWAKIIFTVINFVGLYVLLGDKARRFKLYAFGLAIGSLLTYRLSPSALATELPWKFGVGYPLTLLAVLISSTRPVRKVPLAPAMIMVATGGLNFVNGFRSLGGICILTSLLALTYQYPRRSSRLFRLSATRVAVLSLASFLAAMLTLDLYARAAESGLLGGDEQNKYSSQSVGRFGVLLGGRNELFYSTQAIANSPLIGHGSWSEAPADYSVINRLREFGYRGVRIKASEGVSAHSYLLGAWLEGGLPGAVMWVWVLVMTVTAVLGTFRLAAPWALLAGFSCVSLAWDTLFSPYGAQARLTAPFYFVLVLFALRQARASTRNRRGTRMMEA